MFGDALTPSFPPSSSLQINVCQNPPLSQELQSLLNTLREGHLGLLRPAQVIETRQQAVNMIPKVLAHSPISFLQSFQRR